MEKLTVQASVPEKKDKDGKIIQKAIGPYSISVDTGSTAEEQIKMFGDAAVKSNSEDAWTITLQSTMRSGMKRGETQEQLQARLGTAKMGVSNKGVRVDPEQAYLAMYTSATPQRQAEMIAELKKKGAKG